MKTTTTTVSTSKKCNFIYSDFKSYETNKIFSLIEGSISTKSATAKVKSFSTTTVNYVSSKLYCTDLNEIFKELGSSPKYSTATSLTTSLNGTSHLFWYSTSNTSNIVNHTTFFVQEYIHTVSKFNGFYVDFNTCHFTIPEINNGECVTESRIKYETSKNYIKSTAVPNKSIYSTRISSSLKFDINCKEIHYTSLIKLSRHYSSKWANNHTELSLTESITTKLSYDVRFDSINNIFYRDYYIPIVYDRYISFLFSATSYFTISKYTSSIRKTTCVQVSSSQGLEDNIIVNSKITVTTWN